jgi:hypothetical protein
MTGGTTALGLAGAAYYKKGRRPGALVVDHPRDRVMEGVGVSDEDAARMAGTYCTSPNGPRAVVARSDPER